jgi:hypothetical protein
MNNYIKNSDFYALCVMIFVAPHFSYRGAMYFATALLILQLYYTYSESKQLKVTKITIAKE